MDKAKFKCTDKDGNVAYYRLTDIVRGTLVFDNITDMHDGLKMIYESNDYFEIVEFNNRFQKPIGCYRDIQLTIRLKEDGFLCESQMSTEGLITAKEECGHREYEVYRQLAAAVEDNDLERVNSTLEFGREHLGSTYQKSTKFLSERCQLLVHKAAKSGNGRQLHIN